MPAITDESSEFKLGKANILREGKDISIVANGAMVYYALQAAEDLSHQGIDVMVINMHTVKPLDGLALEKAAGTGAIVTAEEHQIYGGLGGAVAEYITQHHPVPMEFVAVKDTFGESGNPDELMMSYGLSKQSIMKKS